MRSYSISLYLVLFIAFLDYMGLGIVYPMFSTMLFEPSSTLVSSDLSEGSRGMYLGFLLAAMPIAQFISSPILGILSDKKGRKKILFLTLLLGGAGYLISMVAVFMHNIFLLIASRAIIGFAAGNSSVVSAVIADVSTQETKTKNFGLYSMACGIGFTVGPFLGGICSGLCFALPFFISALALFTSALLLLFFFKESHTAFSQKVLHWTESFINFSKAFRCVRLGTLFLALLLFYFGWSFFYEFIPVTWIYDYNFSSSEIGMLYAFGAGFYALSSGLLIRPIIDRYSKEKVIFAALICLGFLMFFPLINAPFAWIFVYLPVFNFLVALIFPTSAALISDTATKDSQGEMLGVYQSVQSASFSLSPLFAGPLLGFSVYAPLLVGGICTLLAAVFFIPFVLKKPML